MPLCRRIDPATHKLVILLTSPLSEDENGEFPLRLTRIIISALHQTLFV